METIAALVVTYNRLADLKKCLDTLREQTHRLDAIFIVNNGSTDGTAEWLATQTDLLVTTQANLGGAGGFATGIDTAYRAGHTWIWCMDDDCLAAPDALAALVAAPNLGPCIKNSMSVSVNSRDELAFFVDRPNQAYRKVSDMTGVDLIYGVASFFNGTLVHRKVVETIGIPDKKLFIWGDEVEYMTRAQKNGFPIVTVPRSVFYHPASFDRDGIPWPAAWKQYYAVRNQRRVLQNQFGDTLGRVLYASWAAKATLQQAVAKRDNRLYNFLLYGEAALDSLTGNFHKRPDTIRTLQFYKWRNK
ncbi:glycosyltransferase [Hymenobacter nivis]|uniref:Glycosyltransferase n=1 Tax=Hymenobacter nivis TaxID=1850093 RepID=A0A502GWH2_9BACT|nr:glycosyltransferase [Hymenobacter nivis]TPG65580.1 glycosyltransferase [Hymenobacter nivis]